MSESEASMEQKVADIAAVEGKDATCVSSTDSSAVKPDISNVEAPSELEQKIIKQVEFYYGDINLARDKFLQEQIKLDDGWVPLEVMLRFSRLKALSNDEATVAAALRKSTSGLMEVHADGTKIRRSVSKPLPEFSREQQDALKLRFVYAKGFPLDSDLDSLMAFFEKFGTTELVQMRRNEKKEFKGSCFVVFGSDETAKKFLETPDVKYGDVALLREYRHDYFQRKTMEKKQKQQTAEKGRQKIETEVTEKEKESGDSQDVTSRMVKGAILVVDKLPDDVSIKVIRDAFSDFGDVKWVDINKSAAQARVRFAGTDGAKLALEKITESVEGKVKVDDVEVCCSILEGDEEIKHWQDIVAVNKDKYKEKHKDKKRRSGGRRRDKPQRKRAKFGAAKEDNGQADDDDDDDDGDGDGDDNAASD